MRNALYYYSLLPANAQRTRAHAVAEAVAAAARKRCIGIQSGIYACTDWRIHSGLYTYILIWRKYTDTKEATGISHCDIGQAVAAAARKRCIGIRLNIQRYVFVACVCTEVCA